MKKLFFVSAVALITLAACQNETTGLVESKNETTVNKAGNSVERDPRYQIGFDSETKQVTYGGEVLQPMKDLIMKKEVILATEGGTTGKLPYKTNIRCSGTTEGGASWYIVHVYGPGYSGDFVVWTYGSTTVANEIFYTPDDCFMYWLGDQW